jgi:hypothetical protein
LSLFPSDWETQLLLCYFILLPMYVHTSFHFFLNMELYLLNRHCKHCDKLRSETVEYEGILFMNHQIILSFMAAATPTYRIRHIDLYEQILRTRNLSVLIVRKGRSHKISIFRVNKTLIYNIKKTFHIETFSYYRMKMVAVKIFVFLSLLVEWKDWIVLCVFS